MQNDYTPRVNVAKELAEISKDFTHPRELVRETISNSLDASAAKIWIEATIEDDVGEEQLVVRVTDDGIGMTAEELPHFFDLGFSSKRDDVKRIGEKGHGTKIVYNSAHVLVSTKHLDDPNIVRIAEMDAPKRGLNRAIRDGLPPPPVKLSTAATSTSPELEQSTSGTAVAIHGYDGNNFPAFAHGALRDYIQWFTAWGAVNAVSGVRRTPPCRLLLKGIGCDIFEEIPYGHPFPDEDYDFQSLRKKDDRRPESYFVRRWIAKALPVLQNPGKTITVVFSVEGDSAKRDSNSMLKRRGRTAQNDSDREYRYGVTDRYGIYLCKDFIPVERKNERFSSTSTWTKWHAFINSQDFHLTANRSSVENTPSKLLEAIYDTADAFIQSDVLGSDEYEEFAARSQLEEGRRKADRERKEHRKRVGNARRKRKYRFTYDGKQLAFTEPRNEQEVLWLLSRLDALWPGLFFWESVVDLDARFGYDLLVKTFNELTQTQEYMFAELKHVLRDSGDFNHSFATLASILCWTNKLSISEESSLSDIQGAKRRFQTSGPNSTRKHTRFFLASDDVPHHIEVFVLERYLGEVGELAISPPSTNP